MFDDQIDGGAEETALVSLHGELDAFAAGRVRELMAEAAHCRRLVIDLSDVSFVDSSGLGAIVSGIRRVRAIGGAVAVAVSPGPVERLLRTAGFDRVVRLARSVDEARATLDSPIGVSA